MAPWDAHWCGSPPWSLSGRWMSNARLRRQVVNHTAMEVALGMRQSMRRDPVEISSLSPGRHAYLPVLRPEPGMLCICPLSRQEPGGSATASGACRPCLLCSTAATKLDVPVPT